MFDNLKNQIESKNFSDGFIKVTDNPVSTLTSEQKVILNIPYKVKEGWILRRKK